MECRHKIVLNSRLLFITVHTKADYHFGIPFLELLNPLRYSVTLFQKWTLNKGGRASITASNFVFRCRRRLEGKTG